MTSVVPFVDLERQHAPLRAELDAAWAAVLARGDFILGRDVEEFEREFAAFCGTAHAVGVGCGLDALSLTLQALGIGPGDEVIAPAHTFIATVNAISRVGATPVLVDCRGDTLCIDPERIEAAITPRTEAILPVHLYGRLAEMEAIGEIAARHGLAIVEDAAQAHGARIGGRRAGAIGVAGAFSFYPSKNLGAFGDGGAVTTSDDVLAARVRLLRSYGQGRKNVHDIVGANSRLDTVQAALLRVKLSRLDAMNEERRRAAAAYDERLAGLPIERAPGAIPAESHVHHLYVVRLTGRDRVIETLARGGVQTGVHYPTPVHLQPAYRGLGSGPGSFPHTERAAGELLSLPLFPGITDGEIDRVAEALTAALGA